MSDVLGQAIDVKGDLNTKMFKFKYLRYELAYWVLLRLKWPSFKVVGFHFRASLAFSKCGLGVVILNDLCKVSYLVVARKQCEHKYQEHLKKNTVVGTRFSFGTESWARPSQPSKKRFKEMARNRSKPMIFSMQ
jgi:hypothetical protein